MISFVSGKRKKEERLRNITYNGSGYAEKGIGFHETFSKTVR